MFYQRNRAYSDNDISEFAGYFLPAHPVTRYKSFTSLWKQTRKLGGYVPRPASCAANTAVEDDYFPCCLKCIPQISDRLKEVLAHRSAVTEWLSAQWFWDFGFTLPEELVSLWGIGITKPEAPAPRDRVFLLTSTNTRSYLPETLQQHATLKGEDLHEARMRISQYINFTAAAFPGEIAADTYGQIYVVVPRDIIFGQGKSISERFIRQAVESRYDLPILVHGSEIVVQNGKVSLFDIPLN